MSWKHKVGCLFVTFLSTFIQLWRTIECMKQFFWLTPSLVGWSRSRPRKTGAGTAKKGALQPWEPERGAEVSFPGAGAGKLNSFRQWQRWPPPDAINLTTKGFVVRLKGQCQAIFCYFYCYNWPYSTEWRHAQNSWCLQRTGELMLMACRFAVYKLEPAVTAQNNDIPVFITVVHELRCKIKNRPPLII